uniref:Uncharacterized protein n=1 Tax=Salix viminalis TaxID=40686 RepID=A0A6N2NCI0_SALVM
MELFALVLLNSNS